MSTYLGYDVLDVLVPHRPEPIAEQIARRFTLLDPGTGARKTDPQDAAPRPVRPFHWLADSRAEIASMVAFLDARRGRAIPFWLPSYQQDLVLAADLLNGQSTATIQRVLYAFQMFPFGGARRHIALYRPGVAMTFRKITGATDPGSGTTESITLASAVGADFPAATTIISFLRLCRLEHDDVEFEWHSRDVAEARVEAREIPAEATT